MNASRTVRRFCVALVLLSGVLPQRAWAQIPAEWTAAAATDNWNETANWDIVDVPCNSGPDAYDVTISSTTTPFTPVLNIGCAVTSLTLGAADTVTHNNGVALTIAGGTMLLDGTWSMGSTGSFTEVFWAAGSMLDGAGTVTLSDNLSNRFRGSAATDVLTVPESATITFETGRLNFGSALMGLDNQGTLIASGTTNFNISLNGALTSFNSGVIRVRDAGIATFAGGVLDNTDGSVQIFNGATLDFSGGRLENGTIASFGTGTVRQQNGTGGTLAGTVSLLCDWQMNSAGGFTELFVADATTLSGSATFTLTDNLSNRIRGLASTDVLTVASGATLTFTAGQVNFGSALMGLDNQGTIVGSGTTNLNINLNGTLTSTNSGVIRAADGGFITFDAGIIDNSGGTVEAQDASVFDFAGGRLENGAIATSGSGLIRQQNGAVATLAGAVDLSCAWQMNSTGSFTELFIADATALSGSATFTLTDNLSNRIRGGASTDVLNIASGATLTFTTGQVNFGSALMGLNNQGTIEGSGTTNLNVNLNGTLTSANSGVIRAADGGVVTLAAGAINNAGGTVEAQDASVFDFAGGRLENGAIATSGSGLIRQQNGAVATLAGAVDLSCAWQMNSTGSFTELFIADATTLSGSATFTLTDNLSNRIRGVASTDVLNVAPGATLTFTAGQVNFGSALMGLNNQGTIEGSGTTNLNINLNATLASANSGVIQAADGGVVTLTSGNFDNTGGTVSALADSFFDFAGGRLVGGAITSTGTGRIRQQNGGNVTLGGMITLGCNWLMEAAASFTEIFAEDATTWSGNATFELTTSFNNRVRGVASTDTLTIADGAAITFVPATEGVGGSINFGSSLMNLVNNGAMTVDGLTEFLLDTIACTHNGTFNVVGGGLMNVATPVTGAGAWTVDGSRLLIGSGQQITTTGDATLTNAGEIELTSGALFSADDLTLDGTSILDVNGAARIELSGSFQYAMTLGAGWEWDSGTKLTMKGIPADPCDVGAFSSLEAGGPSYKIPNLTIAAGARIRLVDLVDNTGAGQPEALHVGTLTLADTNAVIHLNGLSIVYDTLIGDLCQAGDSTFLIHSSDPPASAIDARQPSAPDGTSPAGWDSVEITFCGSVAGTTEADFLVAEIGGDGVAPAVASVTELDADTVLLTFDSLIEDRAWTQVTHVGSGSCMRLGYLPADVNQDGTSTATDVLVAIDCLNGVAACADYALDVDRTGLPAPADILRIIDLLNGAGVYDTYNGVSLPD